MPSRNKSVIQKITTRISDGIDAVGEGLQGWEGPDPVFVEDLAVFKPDKKEKKDKPKISL